MNRFVPALLATFALTSAYAEVAAPDAAIITADQYSQAVMQVDCSTVIRMSGVVARHPEAAQDLCATYEQWHIHGIVERLRSATAFLSSGHDRLVVVPNSRIGVSNGRPMINNGVYIVYSNDAGKEWKVIDVGCDHLGDWVRGVYPAYDGYPAFQATVDRPIASR